MDVRSDRRYRFGLPPEELWPVLTNVDRYRRWWPWLQAFDATGFAAGERWTCVVQPPLPYRLRFSIALHEVVPHQLATAVIDGDIVGEARLELTAEPDGCEARLVSHLSPSNHVLRAVAAFTRPLAQLGHDWVLDTGLRQFRTRALRGQ